MNIIALATHLKQVAQEAKKYAAGLASELSDATLEAMQEMLIELITYEYRRLCMENGIE